MHILSLTLITRNGIIVSICSHSNYYVKFHFVLQTADWTIANEFGILQWLPQIPLWLYVVIGLLLLNRSVQHKTKLWRFHLIHHTDTWVDTSLQTGIILVKVLVYLPLWEF
jgi:hypothetical protein